MKTGHTLQKAVANRYAQSNITGGVCRAISSCRLVPLFRVCQGSRARQGRCPANAALVVGLQSGWGVRAFPYSQVLFGTADWLNVKDVEVTDRPNIKKTAPGSSLANFSKIISVCGTFPVLNRDVIWYLGASSCRSPLCPKCWVSKSIKIYEKLSPVIMITCWGVFCGLRTPSLCGSVREELACSEKGLCREGLSSEVSVLCCSL